jgi:hypothetical protein
MSLGNDNATPANLGSNFNFQLKVLKGFDKLITLLTGGGPTPTVRTPSVVRATGAGSIPAGSRAFTVYNAGNASGTLLGQTIKAKEIMSFSTGNWDTFGIVAYDATGTELVITKVV